VIHSRILEVVARAAHDEVFPTFCAFLQWWDTANLREEDFRGTPGNEGKAFPSVAERAIQGLGKAIKKEKSAACIQFARDFIAQNYEKYPDQEWFPFYMARALTKSGNAEEGKSLLIPFVRKKQSESWAWHHLAECFSTGDPQRLACLSRAVLCRVDDPKKLFPIRMDLVEELLHAGHSELAKHEVDEVIRVRQSNGKVMRDDLLEITRSDWYRNAQAKDGTTQYKEWAENAAAVLTSGLPWHDAVLGVKGVTIGENKVIFAILDIRQSADGIASVPVKMKAFALLADSPVGTPLALQIDTDSDRPLIVSVRVRDGEPWDILPTVPALVRRVNAERGVTTLLAEDGTECFAYHNDVSVARSLTPGSVVSCAIVKDARRTKVRNVSEYTGTARSALWRDYCGSFRPREQGGGHIGDVFAHARLTSGFAAGMTVRGMAVKTTDAETRRSWWEAVTAEPANESTEVET
jgi:cold shock CspA family protein